MTSIAAILFHFPWADQRAIAKEDWEADAAACLAGLVRALASVGATQLGDIDLESRPANLPAPDAADVRAELQGSYHKHPERTMLATLSMASPRPVIDQLAGAYLLAWATMDDPDAPEFRAARYGATLAIRKLIQRDDEGQLSAILGAGAHDDRAAHLATLRAALHSSDGGAPRAMAAHVRRCIEDLERFHAFSAGARKPQPGRERGSRNPASPSAEPQHATGVATTAPLDAAASAKTPQIPAPPFHPDEPAAPPPDTERSPRGKLRPSRALVTPRQVEEAKRRGEPTLEAADTWEVTVEGLAEEAAERSSSRAPQQRLSAGHFEMRARRASAQGISFADPATLRATDIELLLAIVVRMDCAPATRAVIAAIIYSGQAPSSLPKWTVDASADEQQGAHAAPLMTIDPLGLTVPMDAIADLPKSGTGVARKRASSLRLPWSASWRGVAGLVAHAKLKLRTGEHLFMEDEIRAAEVWIREATRGHTTALTLRRLQQLLAEQMQSAGVDEAELAVLTGQRPTPHLKVRLFYRQLPASALIEHYVAAAARVSRTLLGDAQLPAASGPLEDVLGSLRCPESQDAATWVTSLVGAVGAPPRGRPSLARVRAFHLRFSSYVVQMLWWSSGARPHQKSISALQPLGGLLLLDEKAKGIAAIRGVPLPPIAMIQWRLYVTHRHWVLRFLGVHDAPLFFWIDESRQARPLSPSTLHVASGNPFEANAQRHYYASSLRLLGIPGVRVNALMGHAGIGEEAGGRYRAQDSGLHDAALMTTLEQRMAKMGWATLEGMGRG